MAFGKRKKRRRKKTLTKTIRRMLFIVALVVFVGSGVLNWFFSTTEIRSMLALTGEGNVNLIRRSLKGIDGITQYADSVMEVYRSIPEEIRQEPDSDAYRAYFREFEEDPVNLALGGELSQARDDLLLLDVYLAMYDEDTAAMVYLSAPPVSEAQITAYRTGDWEEVPVRELDRFENDLGSISYMSEDREAGGTILFGSPIRRQDESVACYVVEIVPMLVANVAAGFYLSLFLFVLAIISILIVLICRRYVKRRIIRPITRISDAAEQYASDRLAGDTSSMHFEQLDIHTGDELEELSNVMAGMEKDLTRYELDLARAAAEQERIKTELTLAADIQDSMLPNHFPAFPDRNDFDIFASMDPAKEVGGDFYDFFLTDENHLAIVIADVSGKGIPAALFMMTSKLILNNYATLGLGPAETMERANNRICALDLQGMFVTVWLGILDLRTGEVKACNAGHEYPVIRQGDGSFELMRDDHGLVAGALEGVPYEEYSFTLEKGSMLFLYTDGVPEASNAGNEMYGTDRMMRALNRKPENDPKKILQMVREDVDDFVQEAEQFDDLTMLCLCFK